MRVWGNAEIPERVALSEQPLEILSRAGPWRLFGEWWGERCFARDYFEGVLIDLRKSGYDVGYGSDPRTQLLQTIHEFREVADSAQVGAMLAEIMQRLEQLTGAQRGKTRQPVNNITAPIFGATGQVVLTLTLHGFKKPLSKREVARIGKRLLSSVETVTKAIHGLLPDDWPKRR